MISFDKRCTDHIWGNNKYPDWSNFYEVQELLDSRLWREYADKYSVVCDAVELIFGNCTAFLCNPTRDIDSSRVVRADTAFELHEFFRKTGIPVSPDYMARLERINDVPVPKRAFELLAQLRSGWPFALGFLRDHVNNSDGTLCVDVMLPGKGFDNGKMHVTVNGGALEGGHPNVYSVSAYVEGRGCHSGVDKTIHQREEL